MRSLYRRHIKISLLEASQAERAHGWASTEDGTGTEVRHYFVCDQERFLHHLKQPGIASLRLQLEKLGVHPKSITIKRAYNTLTYKNLSYRRERAVNQYEMPVAA
jgi:hypothetical protein